MDEKQIKALIEKNLLRQDLQVVEKMQYTMDFGEIAIQYDFCLN